MAFTITREFFKENVTQIKVEPYYQYAICFRVYQNGTYELFNFESIPTDKVAKIAEMYLNNHPSLKSIRVEEGVFEIPEDRTGLRKKIFDFLISIEKEKLETD